VWSSFKESEMGRIYEDVRKSILKETAAILAQVGKEPAKKKASKISSLAQGIEALQKEQDRVLPPVQGAAPGNEAGNAQHRIPHANDHADALSLLQNCWRNVISILLDTYRSSALPEEFHELIRRYFFLLQDMIRKAATPVIESPVLTEHEEKLAQLDAFVFWLERRPQYDFLACSERDGPSPIKGALNPTKHKKVERLLENARDIIQIEKNKPNPDVRTAAKGISHLFLRASKLPEVQSDRTRFFSIVGESRTAKHMDRLSHELDAALKLTTLPWAETTARPNDAQELLSPDETQALCGGSKRNFPLVACLRGLRTTRCSAITDEVKHQPKKHANHC
jgi:hypothetical protein